MTSGRAQALPSARRHSAISSVTYSSVSPSASSSAASDCCSASASSVRPSDRRHRATHQRAIRVLPGRPDARARRARARRARAPPRRRPRRASPTPCCSRRTRPSAARRGRATSGRAPSRARSTPSARAGGSTIPSMCAASTARRVLARATGELPRGEERVAAPALAPCRVRDAAALEQDADAAAVVVGAESGFGVVERPVRVLEPALEPLGACELAQRLRDVPTARLLSRPHEERGEAALARGRVAEVPEVVQSVERDVVHPVRTAPTRRRTPCAPPPRPAAPRTRRASRRSRRRACRPSRRRAARR